MRYLSELSRSPERQDLRSPDGLPKDAKLSKLEMDFKKVCDSRKERKGASIIPFLHVFGSSNKM